jgi:hypothetical protein
VVMMDFHGLRKETTFYDTCLIFIFGDNFISIQ